VQEVGLRMADGAATRPGLVGDIGGTNARFALAQPTRGRSQITDFRSLKCADYPTVLAALDAYFDEIGLAERPRTAVMAVAGPVEHGAIAFTNMGWRFSEQQLRQSAGFEHATLINDYAALALAAPVFEASDLRRLGPETPGQAGATLAVLGAGTGFGASALVRDGGREAVMTTEGGHIGFAPTDALEAEIWRRLRRDYGRVSVERVLSGPGLLNLYRALREIEDGGPELATPDEVTRGADTGCALALRAVRLFCAILGAVAGDLALAYGAQGGVFIAGGVAPNLIDHLEQSDFRQHFEAKGRFAGYLRAIPTAVVTHPQAALLGAGRALVEAAG
jgi:glucokinase